MNNVRDYFPNLNEFCSTDSKAIIAWMADNNITRSQWNYKSIFERKDIFDLIESCPNIEFMIDGIIESFWDSIVIDNTLLSIMEHIVLPNIYMYGIKWSDVAMEHHKTISKFMKHSYSPARARILIWCVSRLNYESTPNVEFKNVRKFIVSWVVNNVNS